MIELLFSEVSVCREWAGVTAGVKYCFGAPATRMVSTGSHSCFDCLWPRGTEWALGLIVISLFTEPFCLANYPSAFHSVMFNPVEPRLLATANSKEGVGLWDIRKPQRWAPFIHMVLKLAPASTFRWCDQQGRENLFDHWSQLAISWHILVPVKPGEPCPQETGSLRNPHSLLKDS